MIAEYPKPVVALADGITMGGGIGLAGHAAIRIVTERSQLAMPETRIGFTPDVGGTWLLGRAPGRLGEYFGLTGAVMNGADAVYLGFADHYVPSERLEALSEALAFRADPTSPSEIVLLFDETPEPSQLPASREWIDEAFSAPTVSEIIERLQAQGTTDAAATADLLESLAPTGLTVTLDAVREARDLPGLRAALEGEYPPRDVVRERAPRPRRGHPRADRRQGSQPEVGPGDPGRARPGRRCPCARVRSAARPVLSPGCSEPGLF